METNASNTSMMGFARYKKREGVEVETLIEACMKWRSQFLEHQEGIIKHYFLGNLKGEFADAIFARDQAAYQNMAQRYPENESSKTLMTLLEPGSIRLAPTTILKDSVNIETDFSCIEFGTFQPKKEANFSEDQLLAVSKKIEDDYLAQQPETREHFIGKVDKATYAEVSFVKTLGAARKICHNYVNVPICGEMLTMFDSETVDVDFWYLLA